MIYYQKKKEFFFSKPTNLFDLYICIHQATVCGWIMIIDVVNISSNILICVSPCSEIKQLIFEDFRDDQSHSTI